MRNKLKVVKEIKIERPTRAKISEKEALKRMETLSERKEMA
jgi:hypothetical protein